MNPQAWIELRELAAEWERGYGPNSAQYVAELRAVLDQHEPASTEEDAETERGELLSGPTGFTVYGDEMREKFRQELAEQEGE